MGIHTSLEKRWAATEKEVALLAVFFNPYIKDHTFKAGNILTTPGALATMAEALYTRMFSDAPPLEFSDALMDYREGLAEFSDTQFGLERMKRRAVQSVSTAT